MPIRSFGFIFSSMQVRRLSLTNFRNYSRLELDLPGGVILLHGDNAQGKTNLLEAIYFLATTRSPHASQDQQLLNWDALLTDEPVVVGRLVADVQKPEPDTPLHLEMRLIVEERGNWAGNGTGGFRREALINRRKVRLMDLLGKLRVVLFLPEDVDLATGPPVNRRRYMNVTLCQVDADYCRDLSAYNKVLEQRNALLRRMAEGQVRDSADLLQILTDKLIEPGSRVVQRRAQFLREMAYQSQEIYFQDLIGGKESLRLGYLPGWHANNRKTTGEQLSDGDWLQAEQSVGAIQERLAAELTAARAADLARGSSTVGPHRDDWAILVNGKNLGQFGSRGQVRTAILALKLAEINWMKATTADVPILLLDEVIAELDLHRRGALLAYVADQVREKEMAQALLTATDPGMFPVEFLTEATNLLIRGGRVAVDAP
ncbi:MAG: DNA replication/repair protein RecF [Candidatus Promineofilum sp.]|uniref:DNA replication/repair protein RecF n=1 Tax=Promineifilum sp. TaxID=2664178 RepID=UPI002411B36A|nr:DNA replication/repair protein RecF [Promineifilum sp.]MCO5180990.1 DNA replication and repair protein RecF [Promineifilum sp.]